MGNGSLRARALYFTGLATRGMGYPELGSHMLAKAVAIEPENHFFHYELGVAHRRRHALDDAETSFRRALELKPEMAGAMSGLGDVFWARGDVDAAVAQYEKALSLDSNFAQAHLGLGLIRLDQYLLGDAAGHFRRAVELDPGLSQAGGYLDEIIDLQKTLKARIDELMEKVRGNAATKGDGYELAGLLYRATFAGMRDWAVSRAREWVAADPENQLAAYKLAGLEGRTSPPAPPDGYIELMFDGNAEKYNIRIRELSYQGPDLIRRLIDRHGHARGLDVLDAGCGTGLCAVVLKPYARTLAGVDFSAKMLELAKKGGLYDKLYKSDIVSFLREHPAAYDLIAASDVFCYFGDISEAIAGTAKASRDGGLVAFTVEHDKAGSEFGWRLQPHGRYCHTETYVRGKVKEAGLALIAIETDLLRQELGVNVEGLAVLARKEF